MYPLVPNIPALPYQKDRDRTKEQFKITFNIVSCPFPALLYSWYTKKRWQKFYYMKTTAIALLLLSILHFRLKNNRT